MKLPIKCTLKIILLLFFMVPLAFAKKSLPPKIDLRIDLEWTVDELLANAPTELPDDYGKYSTLRTYLLYNVDPCVTYRGKEVSFKGATSTFLTYQYEVPVSIRINDLDVRAKSLSEIKEKLTILLPAIDALGFKRKKGNEGYSAENFPLPKTYREGTGSGITWESTDGTKLLKLLIGVPPDPQHYHKEKKYFLSFAYYDQIDEKILKKNWLQKLKNRSNSNGKPSAG